MKVKEESEKVGLKLNIQNTKIMASGSITSWEIDGETVETVSDFIFLGSKITADGDCINCSPSGSFCLWDVPSKNTGVDCHFLLQVIFLTQGSNLRLLHCRQILYH